MTPLPIPPARAAAARMVLLVGGSFDPPHTGHVVVPAALRAEVCPDGPCSGGAWLVYVPAARSPLKSRGPIAPAEHRVAMLRLALAGVPDAVVWTDEIDRARTADRPSYTIDTLRRARAGLDACGAGATPLGLCIGADQAIDFHRWKDARAIMEVARVFVMGRRGVGDRARVMRGLTDSGFWSPEDIRAWSGRVFDLARAGVEASSTEVRAALERAERPAAVSEPVLRYIDEHHLYASPPEPGTSENP